MWKALLSLLRSLISLFRSPTMRPSPWSLEELGDFPSDLDLEVVQQNGGLSNDGSTAWIEKSLHHVGIIVRRVPGRNVERIAMYQIGGAQVDLRLGNMNDSHDIAGMAMSNPQGSTWGIVIHDGGAQVWLRPSTPGVHISGSGIDNQGLVVGNGPSAVFWEYPTADLQPISNGAVLSLNTSGISPTGRHVAGSFVSLENHLLMFPWFQSSDGAQYLNYVEFGQPGTAHDINARQMSCGESKDSATGLKVAWRYDQATNKTNWLLGLSNDENVNALSLNHSGAAVGCSGNRAVMWANPTSSNISRAIDLTSLFNDPTLVLSRALRINDNHDILCFGWRIDATGQKHYKMFLVRNSSSRFHLP